MSDRRGRIGGTVGLLLAGVAGLTAGFALRLMAVVLRDHGPAGDGWSLRGNGAAVVLPLALLLLIAGAVVCMRRGGWQAALAWPAALALGLFAGGGF